MSSLLTHFTDAEGDPISFFDFDQPENGSVALVGGVLTYTPYADFNGQDYFAIRVTDGQGSDDSDYGYGYVFVNVLPINDAPVALEYGDTTYVNLPFDMYPIGGAGDADGDVITVLSFTQPSHGTLTLNGDGVSLHYTPNTDWVGIDGFGYTISDGHGGTSSNGASVGTAPFDHSPQRVWLDRNGNGLQDYLEPGIAGVAVEMWDLTTRTLVAAWLTDLEGQYSFVLNDGGTSIESDLGSIATYPTGDDSSAAHDYQIIFTNPDAGMYDFTTPHMGPDIYDSDASLEGLTPTFQITGPIMAPGAEEGDPPVVLKWAEAPPMAAGMVVANEVRLTQLTFKTDLVVRDDSGNALFAPHWNDHNGDGIIQTKRPEDDSTAPLVITRGTRMVIKSVYFEIQGDANVGWKDYLPGGTKKVRLRAQGPDGIQFGYDTFDEGENGVEGELYNTGRKNGTTPIFGIRLKNGDLESDDRIANNINYYQEFKLKWEILRMGGGNWYSPATDTSTTPVYVTFDTPLAGVNGKLRETLLWVTAQQFLADPNGDYRTPERVANLIFKAFLNRDVKRKDGVKLEYWGNWNTTTTTFGDLLQNRTGACGAFSDLFEKMLAAQGIVSTAIEPQSKFFGSNQEYMLINNWDFDEPNITTTDSAQEFARFIVDNKGVVAPVAPGFAAVIPQPKRDPNNLAQNAPAVTTTYEYFNVPVVGDRIRNQKDSLRVSSRAKEHLWQGAPDVTWYEGVGGQNNAKPKAIFPNHRLTQIVQDDGTTKLYDASYGKKYNSLADFESKAVAGFVIEKSIKESDVNIDLDGDGKITAGKNVRLFLFRKNGEEQDLI